MEFATTPLAATAADATAAATMTPHYTSSLSHRLCLPGLIFDFTCRTSFDDIVKAMEASTAKHDDPDGIPGAYVTGMVHLHYDGIHFASIAAYYAYPGAPPDTIFQATQKCVENLRDMYIDDQLDKMPVLADCLGYVTDYQEPEEFDWHKEFEDFVLAIAF